MEKTMLALLKIPFGIIKKIAWIITKIALLLGSLTAIVYWFNLDMKLAWLLKPHLDKHYDEMERDVRL